LAPDSKLMLLTSPAVAALTSTPRIDSSRPMAGTVEIQGSSCTTVVATGMAGGPCWAEAGTRAKAAIRVKAVILAIARKDAARA
jgi:hypothetical protein